MQKQLPYERVSIDSLVLDPRNARKHDKRNLKAIKDSLVKFGQQRTIVVTKDNVVIAGNGTVAAARELGWETIDITRSQLTGEDAIAYGLVDNRASELAEWDDENLKSLLSELNESGWDIEGLGWDSDDLEGILDKPVVDGLTDEDDIPEVPQNVFGVKLGDIWQLGNHRLMCGDSTDKATVEKLMNGDKADMVFTDPPYNVNYESDKTGKIKNDNMSDEKFAVFLRGVFSRINEVVDSGFIYIWHATLVVEFDNIIREFDWEINNKICWVKDIPSYSMARYKWQYEPCYFLLKGKPKWKDDKTRTNVWNVKSIQSAGSQDDRGNSWFKGGSKGLTVHPTQKPVELALTAINHCNPKLTVDFFTGSGSTLIACEKTGRKCYGMELDPHYCSVIIKRWQDFTGKEAVKL